MYVLELPLEPMAVSHFNELCGEQDVQVVCLDRDAYRQVWILKGIDHFLE